MGPMTCEKCGATLPIAPMDSQSGPCINCSTIDKTKEIANGELPDVILDYAGKQTTSEDSQLAITSITCGVVCYPLLLMAGAGVLVAIIGAVSGMMALVKMRLQPGKYRGKGMAILGICLSCPVLLLFFLVLDSISGRDHW